MHSLVSTQLNTPGERSSASALPRAAPLPIPLCDPHCHALPTPAVSALLKEPQILPGPPTPCPALETLLKPEAHLLQGLPLCFLSLMGHLMFCSVVWFFLARG